MDTHQGPKQMLEKNVTEIMAWIHNWDCIAYLGPIIYLDDTDILLNCKKNVKKKQREVSLSFLLFNIFFIILPFQVFFLY